MCRTLSSYCLLVSLVVTAVLGINLNQHPSLAGAISQNNLTVTPVRHCTSDAGWYGPSSFAEGLDVDCGGTYSILFAEYEKYSIHAQFEFLPFGAAQVQPHRNAMRTPRRYTYGSCTTAIVNLKDVPVHYVPDAQGPFIGSAVTTFYTTTEKFLNLAECNRRPISQIGWIAIDAMGELGLMQFGTRSPLSRDLPRGVHPV